MGGARVMELSTPAEEGEEAEEEEGKATAVAIARGMSARKKTLDGIARSPAPTHRVTHFEKQIQLL
jgi:hypothetical protein